MSHACHRFWKCCRTLTFCSLLRSWTIPCHAKRHLNLQKWSKPLVFLTFWLRNVLRTTTACTLSTSEPPKMVRTWCVLYILTWKCASRHNGVHLLFRHLNCQKWSAPLVLCTFWLGNVLRTTTACTFLTSQLPKALRAPGVSYILTCKCASHHNGVQFFISHLASWLRTRRFSEPTFRPSGAPNHSKNTAFRDFPTFSRICIFFLLTLLSSNLSLLSLPLPCSAFHLSILSEVWLLNFLRPFSLENHHFPWSRFSLPFSLEKSRFSLETSGFSLEKSKFSLENSKFSVEKSRFSLETSKFSL